MRLTAIIPCRNEKAHPFFAACSVLNQDGLISRLVVVDDGSTDGTLETLRSMLGEPEIPVETIRLEQSVGPATARNLALRAAWDVSDAFCFLDGHDQYEEGYAKAVLAAFRDPRVGLAYTDEEYRDEVKLQYYVKYREPYDPERLRLTNIAGGSYAVTKAALMASGPFDESRRVGEMHELARRIARTHVLTHIPEVLVRTHLTETSLRLTVPMEEWLAQS